MLLKQLLARKTYVGMEKAVDCRLCKSYIARHDKYEKTFKKPIGLIIF